MKKFLCLVLALAVVLSLTACNGTNGWKSSVTNYEGEVSSNGGFAVVKGDYVYYINGVESNSATNDFGTPVKGALLRTKVADLGTENASSEVVIPKLVFTNATDGSNGFYIFGDYVYYTSPSTSKDKTGAVQYSNLEYLRTKLDGTKTTVITTTTNLTTPFRYVEADGNVYLVIYTTNDDGDNVLVSYDASKEDTIVKTSGKVSSYLFSDNNAESACYYVAYAHDDVLDKDESFQNLVKFNFNGDDEVTVLEGSDGTQGATYALIKDTGSALYFSKTYVDTTVISTTKYYVANNYDFASDKIIYLSETTTNSSNVFATTSYFKSPDCIVYYDSTLGFLKYDYTDKDNNETYGVTYLVKDKKVLAELTNLSLSYYTDDYCYMTDSSNYYYRVNLSKLLASESVCEIEQITYVALNPTGAFTTPEIIGDCILCTVTTEPFYSYVYAIKMVTGLTDEEKEAKIDTYDFTVQENVENFAKLLLGQMTEENKTSYDKFIEETFEDEDEE